MKVKEKKRKLVKGIVGIRNERIDLNNFFFFFFCFIVFFFFFFLCFNIVLFFFFCFFFFFFVSFLFFLDCSLLKNDNKGDILFPFCFSLGKLFPFSLPRIPNSETNRTNQSTKHKTFTSQPNKKTHFLSIFLFPSSSFSPFPLLYRNSKQNIMGKWSEGQTSLGNPPYCFTYSKEGRGRRFVIFTDSLE